MDMWLPDKLVANLCKGFCHRISRGHEAHRASDLLAASISAPILQSQTGGGYALYYGASLGLICAVWAKRIPSCVANTWVSIKTCGT